MGLNRSVKSPKTLEKSDKKILRISSENLFFSVKVFPEKKKRKRKKEKLTEQTLTIVTCKIRIWTAQYFRSAFGRRVDCIPPNN